MGKAVIAMLEVCPICGFQIPKELIEEAKVSGEVRCPGCKGATTRLIYFIPREPEANLDEDESEHNTNINH